MTEKSYCLNNSNKPKILVTRPDIPEIALRDLSEKCDIDIYPDEKPMPREILMEKIRGKDGLFCLITDRIDKEILDAAGESLKVVATMSVGYDHLDLDEMKKGESNGGWEKCAWSPLWMTGSGLSGSTVGIFGLGRIGLGVLKRLQGFSVKKFIYTSQTRKKEGDDLGAEFVSFDQLLRDSDFIIITSALTKETENIFNKDAFAIMKTSSILINTSRGGLIDQNALIDALKSGQILAAGLDVMVPEPIPIDHPLINTPNLTLLPHIGSAEKQTRLKMASVTVENLIAGVTGTTMPERLC